MTTGRSAINKNCLNNFPSKSLPSINRERPGRDATFSPQKSNFALRNSTIDPGSLWIHIMPQGDSLTFTGPKNFFSPRYPDACALVCLANVSIHPRTDQEH